MQSETLFWTVYLPIEALSIQTLLLKSRKSGKPLVISDYFNTFDECTKKFGLFINYDFHTFTNYFLKGLRKLASAIGNNDI